ncbi:MAG: hypothetical protein AABX70_08550 [Nanoarchaeota archaeon]
MTIAVSDTLEVSTLDLTTYLADSHVALAPIKSIDAVNGEVYAYELLLRVPRMSAEDAIQLIGSARVMPILAHGLAQIAYQESQTKGVRYHINIHLRDLTDLMPPQQRTLVEVLMGLEAAATRKGHVGVEIHEATPLTPEHLALCRRLCEAGVHVVYDDVLKPKGHRPYEFLQSLPAEGVTALKLDHEMTQRCIGNQGNGFRTSTPRDEETYRAVSLLGELCARRNWFLMAEGANRDTDLKPLRGLGFTHYQLYKETGRIGI